MSASVVTTQGLMVVAKFLAVKGPRGTYSHFCTSLVTRQGAGAQRARLVE